METSELLKKVRKIEIKTRGLSNHLFSGEYHTVFKGRGMSFSEVRGYQYGDDVRTIDWNVTARTNEPHVKVFEEERELTVMLLVDISGSAFFGTARSKHEIMTEIAAVLSFSAINNNDKVGMMFFSDTVEKFIPPKKGRQHILRIIRELVNVEPSAKSTNLEGALQSLNNIIKKRCITFVLSDFMTTGYENALRIASKRHDIIGIHLFDPSEEKMPDLGLVRVHDAETDEARWLDTSSQAVRDAHNAWFAQNLDYFKKTFLRIGADAVSISTKDSYVNALIAFFQKRM